jgi:hypothetical protein
LKDRKDKIRSLSDSDIKHKLRQIPHKVETFAASYKTDLELPNGYKRIMSYADNLDDLMAIGKKRLEEENPKLDDCVSALKDIKSTNVTKIEEILYLARDIIREFDADNGIS